MGRVQDKVVVVTGAANGLGEAIALRLAHEDRPAHLGARRLLGPLAHGRAPLLAECRQAERDAPG